jgi:hypothetical protein
VLRADGHSSDNADVRDAPELCFTRSDATGMRRTSSIDVQRHHQGKQYDSGLVKRQRATMMILRIDSCMS